MHQLLKNKKLDETHGQKNNAVLILQITFSDQVAYNGCLQVKLINSVEYENFSTIFESMFYYSDR